MSGVKLTKAQVRELKEIAGRDYWSAYCDGYAPIRRLHELGYVSCRQGKFGTNGYSITPSGLQALGGSNAPSE